MKKRISSIRKIFVTVLAAALISGMTVPAAAFAQEAETQEDPVIMEEENSETELQKAETPEEEDPTEPEDPEEEDPTESGDPEGEDPDGTETPGTETPVIPPVTIPPMAMAVPMDTSDPMYAQLEQFLTLIAGPVPDLYGCGCGTDRSDQSSDPSAWQPTVPEEAVEVSLAIPEGYDPSRTVVAEIGQSAGSQTPAWTEITYQNINGGAVFKTDHSGLFVIAEEKQWKDIPASLEMTSKLTGWS